jgi:cyclophilin family peptidyl-prolyl cis-trans isomerase/HEAT repeat protein
MSAMQPTMRIKLMFVFAAAMTAAAPVARAASRYAPLLATTSGQDTLRNIALYEDQRVSGDGALFAYLQEGSPLVQLRAIVAIGRIQDPADAPRLIPFITSKDRTLVAEAIFELGQLANRDAADPLIKARPNLRVEEQVLVAEALGKIGGDAAVAALNDMLHDFSAAARAEAALGLARNKHPEAANSLLLAIYDPDPTVARNAIYALEKQEALPRTCAALFDLLDNASPDVRMAAARTLGKLKCPETADKLIHMLDDDEVRVVVNAAIALGDLQAKAAGNALGRVLTSHKSQHARAAAAIALEQIADKNTRDAIMQGLLDRSAMVRIHSVRAMAAAQKKESDMFIDQMRADGHRLVRAAAIECYGVAGLSGRTQELLKIARDDKDPMMRVAAIHALEKFKGVASIPPALVPLMLDPDYTVAEAAASALGTLQYRAAAPQLVEAYYAADERNFPDVELATIGALGEIGAAEADTMLVQAMSHPDVRVRTLANDTLVKLGKTPPAMRTPREFHEEHFDRSRRKSMGPPLGIKHAVIKTGRGDIEIELFGDDAIQTVTHFIDWSKKGFYRKLTIHRIVPNHVVQGGDPRGDGSGDAGFTIPAENSPHRYDTGTIGIADAGLDTGSCQWFIALTPRPHLNGRYTVIGRVTKGMENVMKLDQGDTFDVKILD